MAIGGPLKEVSIAGRIFTCPADGDYTFVPGGAESALEPNGDGATARKIITVTTWSLEGLQVHCEMNEGTLEFLLEQNVNSENVPITMTFMDDTTYQAKGTVIGKVEYSHAKALATVSLGGPGSATKQ
jgi:hypothetical protein